MKKILFDELPNIVMAITEQLDRIEETLLKEKHSKETVKKKYKVPEAAAYCNMSTSTFRLYVYQRKVAGTKFGKAWLFLQSDLDAFIADFRVPTVKELKEEAFTNLTR